MFEIGERPVRIVQRIDLNRSLHRNFSGERQEFPTVHAGAVGNTAHHALMVEQVVVERRNLRHRDAGESERSGFAQVTESERDKCARRSKDDGSVEWLRRFVLGASDPDRAQFFRKLPMRASAGENVHFATLVACQLKNQVG